ncbi:uncharacterized protein Z518_07721 [Rhinocladiella mackenziei CBS 650.93]|uniref:Uncharacterized protein n=1 Tax=Rhinocladiella mackenziei CBS 650.93 TaxID=1442369 RepID=A0A0D2FPN3_9EURO|nr:uncharacterized protein Z518_07721 [Rhinocladiella mackenziei CBS 650.93]KIX04167.1 hypothetical protein Z518_07721 [Rhinocladiella mackenziei CBS 650.93]
MPKVQLSPSQLTSPENEFGLYMAFPSPSIVQHIEINKIRYPKPIRKLPSLHRKQSEASLCNSSDGKKRKSKSAPYRDAQYEALLAPEGGYMFDFDPSDGPKSNEYLCRTLLEMDRSVPPNSLFSDDKFEKHCQELEGRNEVMITQDISRLNVPSTKDLASLWR